MLLNEIFNTANYITWHDVEDGMLGEFEVDDEKYFINAEEYKITLSSGTYDVLDIGFTKGDSSAMSGDNKPGRVMGTVLNGVTQKVKELKPNIVMFGAITANGEIEKRKSIYRKMASWIARTTVYTHLSKWYAFSGGEYMFVSDFTPTEEDGQIIEKLAAYSK